MVYSFNGWRLISFICLYFAFAAYFKIKRKKDIIYLFFLAAMWVYLGEVISCTQFPIHAVEGYGERFFDGQNVWREMNFIPFKMGFDWTCLLNIIMTIPLGFGLPFLIKGTYKKMCISGFVFGVAIELGQLVSALYAGYTFRSVDITDVVCNFFGAFIGYSLFKIFKVGFNWLDQKLLLKGNPVVEHIRSC